MLISMYTTAKWRQHTNIGIKLGHQVATEAQVVTISHHYISGSVSDKTRQ